MLKRSATFEESRGDQPHASVVQLCILGLEMLRDEAATRAEKHREGGEGSENATVLRLL